MLNILWKELVFTEHMCSGIKVFGKNVSLFFVVYFLCFGNEKGPEGHTIFNQRQSLHNCTHHSEN